MREALSTVCASQPPASLAAAANAASAFASPPSATAPANHTATWVQLWTGWKESYGRSDILRWAWGHWAPRPTAQCGREHSDTRAIPRQGEHRKLCVAGLETGRIWCVFLHQRHRAGSAHVPELGQRAAGVQLRLRGHVHRQWPMVRVGVQSLVALVVRRRRASAVTPAVATPTVAAPFTATITSPVAATVATTT